MTRKDDGSAVVEFLTVGVLLLVPTLYLVLALGRIEAAVLATESASRSAARAVTAADTETAGRATARALIGYALSDQGFAVDPEAATTITCPVTGCLTPGGEVTVTVELQVTLPGLAGVPAAVPVSATHLAVVDPYRSAP